MAEPVLDPRVVALPKRIVHELTAEAVMDPHRDGQAEPEEPLQDFIDRLVGDFGLNDGEIVHRVGGGQLLSHVAFNALVP
jgi:hypothetical protein